MLTANTVPTKAAVIREYIIDRYSSKGVTMSEPVVYAQNELMAQFCGKYFFAGEKTQDMALNDLLRTCETAKQRNAISQFFHDLVEYFKQKLGGNHNITLELVKLQNKWINLVKDTENTLDTESVEKQYSLSRNFAKEYDNWNKENNKKIFVIGTTSKALQSIGVDEKIITWDGSKIIKILNKHEEITDNIIKQVPNIIEEPVIVMQSKQSNSRITMFGEVYSQGKPILAVLELNPNGKNGFQLNEIKIVSAYGKDNAQKFIDASTILYVDKNKKRVSTFETLTGLQLPVGGANSIITIPNSTENVNKNYSIPDTEYLELAKDPAKNEARLRELVDEAAKDAGYNSHILYHGTDEFGFTQFERMRLDDRRSIFLTDSERIASTYSGVMGKRNVSDKAVVPENISSVVLASELNASMPDYEKENGYSYMPFNEQARKNLDEKIKTELEQVKMFLYTSPKLTSINESDLKVVNQLKEELDKPYNSNSNNISTPLYLLARSGFFAGWRDVKVLNLESNIRLAQQMSNHEIGKDLIAKVGLDGYDVEVYTKDEAKNLLAESQKKGNYALYLNSKNTLKIDCNGKYWNRLEYRADISRFYTVISGLHGYRIYNSFTDQTLYLANNKTGEYESIDEAFEKVKQIQKEKPVMLAYTFLEKTREISRYADLCGYDSVEFENIADNGGSNSDVPNDETSNIYIAFDNKQIKSADLVTYDDEGNIIPLSERFNKKNEDIRYSIPVDKYTEKQYNNFGWVTVNNVITSAERETLLSRYADYKHNKSKYPTTRFGEAVIHSYDYPDVIAYIKGTMRSPEITKVLRIKSKDFASEISEVILHYERQGNTISWQYVKKAFGDGILDVNRRRDFESFWELKAGAKGNGSAESNTDSTRSENGNGSIQPNRENDRADDLTSAFSMPENPYSIPEDQAELERKLDNGEISVEEYRTESQKNWQRAIEEYGIIDPPASLRNTSGVRHCEAVTHKLN